MQTGTVAVYVCHTCRLIQAAQLMPNFCSGSAQPCGRARASDVTVRSAGAVPFSIASTMRGGQIGEGSKIPDVPLNLALAFGNLLEGAYAPLDRLRRRRIAILIYVA